MSTEPAPAPLAEPPDAWDRAAAWLLAHGALPAVGLLVLGMGIIYAGIFRGELRGDDLSFHFAESARLADCLRHGDFDFWNPSANGGFASAYYYQVIPQLASAAPTAVFGHHLFWFQLSVFLPLVLAPLGAYRGMRLLGASPWQSAVAAFALSFTIGASRWGFAGDGTFSVGLYTQTWALAAFPVSLGHAVRWATEKKGLAPAVAWGAFVGLCHPFAVIALGLALLFGYLAQFVFWGIDLALAALGPLLGPWFAKRWQPPAAPPFLGELVRLAIFAVLLGISLLPVLVPLLVDYAGFGGFPHRVNDEVGPGFKELWKWFSTGMILDHDNRRTDLLTWLLPIALVFARGRFFRWLWVPGVIFALFLGMGPHMGKTGADDLLPAVRFLGAMQIVLALGIGAGVYAIGKTISDAKEGSWLAELARWLMLVTLVAICVLFIWQIVRGKADELVIRAVGRLTLGLVDNVMVMRVLAVIPLATILFLVPAAARWLQAQYGIRTGLAAIAAAIGVVLISQGAPIEAERVGVLADQTGKYRGEMMQINRALAAQPPGRKQVGPGCENHWWNLLSYVYERIPAVLQMGGGGLQASPNYDFLWTVRDNVKNAWIFDAPYLVFEKAKASTMPVGEVVIETTRYLARRLPTDGLVSPIQITGVLAAGPTGAHTEVRKAVLAWGKSDMPYANKHLAYHGRGKDTAPPQGKTLRAWRQDSPGDAADIVAEVEVTGATTFVVRESWHPRWHAFVDGVEVPVLRVTPDFPAVEVTRPGTHVVQLRFERPWWAHAAWLLWPGATIAAWLVTRYLRRRRARGNLPEARVT